MTPGSSDIMSNKTSEPWLSDGDVTNRLTVFVLLRPRANGGISYTLQSCRFQLPIG
ncbi:hypothetical protein AMECASPLE_036873, partial [Ameca splendens]